MRDGVIIQQFEQMAAAVTQDNQSLQRSVAMVRTRMDALEALLLGSRFGILKLALLQLISPKLVARMVQAQHADQINQFNKERAAAQIARAKVKAPQQPVIIKAI